MLRSAAISALLVPVGLALALGGAYVVAEYEVHRATKAWASEGDSMEAFVARFPPEPDAPTALRLDGLALPLGIQMLAHPELARPREPTCEVDSPLNGIGVAVGRLDRAADGARLALPEGGEAFLRRESARLDAITEHILEAGPLGWAQDVRQGLSAPIPSLVGLRQLESVLLARAWLADRDGRPAEAERGLEAAWLLSAPFFERADSISQMISVAVARMQHGVLRAIRRPSPVWLSRMNERPFANGFSTALQSEAWGWLAQPMGYWNASDITRAHASPSSKPAASPVAVRVLATPYSQLALAGVLDTLRRMRSDLGSLRRCDADLDAFAKRLDAGIPRWNQLARFATPALLRAWVSQREADLDRELTRRVLGARAERAASGRWPVADVPSLVCEGLFWQQRPAADGTLTIRASARPFRLVDPKWGWSVVVRAYGP